MGSSKEAVVALAQRGAAVDATGVVHEEEQHLERPLLTAAHQGDCDMMRLLVQVRWRVLVLQLRAPCAPGVPGHAQPGAAAGASECTPQRGSKGCMRSLPD